MQTWATVAADADTVAGGPGFDLVAGGMGTHPTRFMGQFEKP